MKKVERNLFTFLFHGLLDLRSSLLTLGRVDTSITLLSLNRSLNIFQQILASFEADAYSDCRVKDGHLCTLLGSKETKDS